MARHPEETAKTTNKKERNSHVIAFVAFVVSFLLFAHITPQHMLIKNEKAHLIWDGKTKLFAHKITMNEMTSMEFETQVIFGYVYMSFIT